MDGADSVMTSIQDTLLTYLVIGDPPTVVSIETASLEVARNIAGEMDNAEVDSPQGSLSLPPLSDIMDVDPDECVQRRVFFSTVNSRATEESSSNVNSNVLRFDIVPCDESRRRRRRRQAPTQGTYLQTQL